jgi:DNA-binding IclR family transcriptional regulator
LLIQLVLHKQAGLDRLARITGIPHAELRTELDPLRRMGLVVRGRQRAFSVNPFVQHVVLERFTRRGLLS